MRYKKSNKNYDSYYNTTNKKDKSSIDALPSIPSSVATTSQVISKDIRIATPDIIVFNDSAIPIDTMTDLIFEDIGGQELINLSRNDIINGQNIIYTPIKNIAAISSKYNSQNIIPTQDTLNILFSNYGINLEDKVPLIEDLVDYSKNTLGYNGIDQPFLQNPIYIDPVSGNIVILVNNINGDEQVEVQILANGNEFNDILYGIE